MVRVSEREAAGTRAQPSTPAREPSQHARTQAQPARAAAGGRAEARASERAARTAGVRGENCSNSSGS